MSSNTIENCSRNDFKKISAKTKNKNLKFKK
jgi:hypothetical protein